MVLGAISGMIPKIEGFAPLPSASADAFMSMQGGHMALYFGAEYTIGKRLIASMSNEDFNKAVVDPRLFINRIDPHYKQITAVFERYLDENVDRIQKAVMNRAYDVEIYKIEQNVKLLLNLPQAYWDALFQTNEKINQSEGQTTTSGRTNPRGTNQENPTPKIKTPTPTIESKRKPKYSGQELVEQANISQIARQVKLYATAIQRGNYYYLSNGKKQTVTMFGSNKSAVVKELYKARTAYQKKWGYWF